MLTPSEVSERRKARKLLEYKRVALEEAVERRACEKVYDKIWRHKSTLDEVRDEKLRSRTAALALVGIGLRDLGIDDEEGSTRPEEAVRELLAPAREGLAKMNEEKFPRGKLQHLTSAHKSIVDTLSTIHSGSSSADEILPTLIYTLITSPTEGINIISNLYFIQRFRAVNKIDGEAAYCITNLEAAISFLENVDLASLRADEAPEGPLKSSSRPATPTIEKSGFSFPPSMPPIPDQATLASSQRTISASNLSAPIAPSVSGSSSPMPSPLHQRRLSNLLQPSAKVIGAANDAVRNTAEEGFKNISTTLDNSFKFLFGRLKEHSSDETHDELVLPKTLDEARQLVSRPVTPEDESMVSETSSVADTEGEMGATHSKPDEKLLGMIGGRKPATLRERSVDSAKSSGSGKRVAFATAGSSSNLAAPPQTISSAQSNALESVRNLGNSLNPLNHIGAAFGGGFRGFSRAIPSPTIVYTEKEKVKTPEPSPALSRSRDEDYSAIGPPIQRFLDLEDSGDLKMKDVAELLQDYQRLAKALQGHAQSQRISAPRDSSDANQS
jgi:Vacuolar sorting protein 9 (VPS9) domain